LEKNPENLMFHFLSLLSTYFIVTRTFNVLTTRDTVCICHAKLKGYLLIYLLRYR